MQKLGLCIVMVVLGITIGVLGSMKFYEKNSIINERVRLMQNGERALFFLSFFTCSKEKGQVGFFTYDPGSGGTLFLGAKAIFQGNGIYNPQDKKYYICNA